MKNEIDCGYLNRDRSCNSTAICEETKCLAKMSNFENVTYKATQMITEGKRLLKKVKELGYEIRNWQGFLLFCGLLRWL
jgi:hypothetical protein